MRCRPSMKIDTFLHLSRGKPLLNSFTTFPQPMKTNILFLLRHTPPNNLPARKAASQRRKKVILAILDGSAGEMDCASFYLLCEAQKRQPAQKFHSREALY